MKNYMFFPTGEPIANGVRLPNETTSEAVAQAERGYPQGGRMWLNGDCVATIPARPTRSKNRTTIVYNVDDYQNK